MRLKKFKNGWLKLTVEEIINPGIQICDPHHHLWDGPVPRGRYLIEDFQDDISGGHNIVKTMSVECGTKYRETDFEFLRSVGETEFFCRQAEHNSGLGGNISIAAGIVAFIDLFSGPNVVHAIEAHIDASKSRLKGIRQLCIWDDDPAVPTMGNRQGMLMESNFRKGFSCLRNYGLVFDAWQYFTQLIELKDLAECYPDTTIVVNHTGGPLGVGRYARRRSQAFDDWKKNISELAGCPNVYMKLGGLGMPRCGFGWHEAEKPPTSTALAEAMAPFFNFCFEKFGINRCMFESNFPVDKVSYSYTVLWNAFKRITKEFSKDEKASLFHDNAVRVYGLV